jgi:MFS family permease
VLDAASLRDANAFRDANAARKDKGAAGAGLSKFSTSESHDHQRNHDLCAAPPIDSPPSISSLAPQGPLFGGTGMSGRQLPIILALGTTQTLAWASSVYLPAILADPIAHDLGISSNWIFAAYSGALAVAAVLGPRVGRQIDRLGGRPVLSLSNLMLAAGLALLGLTHSMSALIAAWLLLGIGMGYGLYDAAFGALGRIYGDAARGPITGITLIAGFASTVGWPLTALGLQSIGWRDTCFAWAPPIS